MRVLKNRWFKHSYYLTFLANERLLGEFISKTKGAVIRCAPKEDLEFGAEKEIRFCLPTITGDTQVVDCLDYSHRKDTSKMLLHRFKNSIHAKDRGVFINFNQYSELCLFVEQTRHQIFPHQYYSRLQSSIFMKLLESNVSGQIKKDYQFRRKTTITFVESNVECIVLIFNKNVFFVPAILWNVVMQNGFRDALFGEECHQVRLSKKHGKTAFKICFRKDCPILLEAELVQGECLAEQKLKDGKPFCAIRGDLFATLRLPSYRITEHANEFHTDYRMYRKIVAKGHIKAKKKSTVKSFTIIYLDFFDEDESEEVIFERNSFNEMIGRSITMLIIPQNCQVSSNRPSINISI